MIKTPAATIIRRRRRRIARHAALQVKRRAWTVFFGVLILFGGVLPLGAIFGVAAAIYSDSAMMLPAPQSDAAALDAARFYDATGTIEIAVRASSGGRVWVALDSLPVYVIDATLIVEDASFGTGTRADAFDLIVRLWHNLLVGAPPPDPTITGRLVRNVAASGDLALLSGQTPRETWWAALMDARTERAAREIALVSAANARYTPAELLEWHLNTNDYGNGAVGIDAAAQLYLGKPASALTLDEAALLASIPTAAQYNPFDDPTAARARAADTLRALVDANRIALTDYESALTRTPAIQPDDGRGEGALDAAAASDYLRYARRQAESILDGIGVDGAAAVARGGVRIVTALDLDLQRQAECTAAVHLNGDAPSDCPAAAFLPPATNAPPLEAPTGDARPPDSAALVVIDAQTGVLRAMVGAANVDGQQPGVTLQPFVYLAGFSQGLTPASMVLDIPAQFPGARDGLIYTVRNLDGRFAGPVSARDALGAYRLPPAAALANRVGMANVLNTAHLLGVNGLNDGSADLMLLERGGRAAVLDIAVAYSTFASMGKLRGVGVEPVARGYRGRDPVAVLRIEARDGRVLWAYDSDDAAACRTQTFCTNLLQDSLAYLINDILADQATRWATLGQGNALDLARPGAVVNGITADRADNWTVGYTPQIVTAVHLGRADGGALALDADGMNGAAAIWRALMEYVHARDALPAQAWARPASIVEGVVCERSGLYPNGVCPVRREWFIDGTQPRASQVDTYWQQVDVNRQTRQIATANTPPELRASERYFVPPPEALTWWRETGQPLPPTEIDTISRPELAEATRISAPLPFAYVGGVVPILGAVDAAGVQFFQLSVGAGLNPAQWTDISGQLTAATPDAPLAVWDTAGLDGLYSVRLTVVRGENQIERKIVQVTVDNQPPAVTLNTDPTGRAYRFPGDPQIVLAAAARDNLLVDRVEFYHDGVLLGADESAPYGFTFPITGVARHAFRAVAYDAVGNTSESSLTVEVTRAGS
jgi:membrane peptidoglycan carboxypeptidase